VESAGPIPGEFSMLSIGACVVDNQAQSFYAELRPINKNFVPKALEVSGFDLDVLSRTGREPSSAMKEFVDWVIKAADGKTPIFVGFNACYDWQFVNWYLQSFTGSNPFGFGGIDIKSYFMGLSGRAWSETTSSKLPAEFQSKQPLTHNALDDARAPSDNFPKTAASRGIAPLEARSRRPPHRLGNSPAVRRVNLNRCHANIGLRRLGFTALQTSQEFNHRFWRRNRFAMFVKPRRKCRPYSSIKTDSTRPIVDRILNRSLLKHWFVDFPDTDVFVDVFFDSLASG